jgi:hypothetical protein
VIWSYLYPLPQNDGNPEERRRTSERAETPSKPNQEGKWETAPRKHLPEDEIGTKKKKKKLQLQEGGREGYERMILDDGQLS